MEQQEIYEPPVAVELGDFTELTRSSNFGRSNDGYLYWYDFANARG
ncbi:lasso RiPP family leader peptide-containing protein [Streptomyces sp. NPDC001262]